MIDLGDNPNIPGNVAQCEWCGYFVNTFTNVELNYCPQCGNGTLRQDCPHCHQPIAFPPRENCLACGKQFTILKLQAVPGGRGSVNIIEPDAIRRKELEAKGNHWYDVVRGQAEGPELPPMNQQAPHGWSQEAFDRLLRGAKAAAGENVLGESQVARVQTMLREMFPGAPMQRCEKCQIEFVLKSEKEAMQECPFCTTPMAPPEVDTPATTD